MKLLSNMIFHTFEYLIKCWEPDVLLFMQLCFRNIKVLFSGVSVVDWKFFSIGFLLIRNLTKIYLCTTFDPSMQYKSYHRTFQTEINVQFARLLAPSSSYTVLERFINCKRSLTISTYIFKSLRSMSVLCMAWHTSRYTNPKHVTSWQSVSYGVFWKSRALEKLLNFEKIRAQKHLLLRSVPYCYTFAQAEHYRYWTCHWAKMKKLEIWRNNPVFKK